MALHILVAELQGSEILHLHCSSLPAQVLLEHMQQCSLVPVQNLCLKCLVLKQRLLDQAHLIVQLLSLRRTFLLGTRVQSAGQELDCTHQ